MHAEFHAVVRRDARKRAHVTIPRLIADTVLGLEAGDTIEVRIVKEEK